MQHRGEVFARELATLVRIEDRGLAVVFDGFLQCIDAEGTVHRV